MSTHGCRRAPRPESQRRGYPWEGKKVPGGFLPWCRWEGKEGLVLTTGTFFKERMVVEERQPMALSVGYSPSDSTCCSPANACPSNRIQLAGRSVPKLTRPSWWASIPPMAPQHPLVLPTIPGSPHGHLQGCWPG